MSVARLCLLAALLVSSGCPETPATDAGTDAAAPLDAALDGGGCSAAADCDDGLFCNGEEQCESGRCAAGTAPCDDGIACTVDRCEERTAACTSTAPDVDGDGFFADTCLGDDGAPLGDDCDDANADVFPGNRELCDLVDQDCDPSTRGSVDDDGDGYESSACCNDGVCGDDCDDARIGSFPGATEVCDGLDQNCSGGPDDGLLIDGFIDADGDSYGDDARPMLACPGTPGWSARGGDCNDDPMTPDARAQSPGQPEICDGIRNDCSTTLAADVGAGAVNWYGDADGDGFGAARSGVTSSCVPVPNASLLDTDCDDDPTHADAPMINPAAAERCNGGDDNCNGVADFRIAPNNYEDDDGDGLIDSACSPLGTDCNDADPESGPGEIERCDMRDNDCDGIVDEGATSVVYYRDLDRDGYGSIASGSVIACSILPGFVPNAGDCNDTDATRFPGAMESCDGADEDCDAAVDETPASLECAPPNTLESTCLAGRCLVDACDVGFEDCNGRPLDGCEIDLESDALNCGRCGTACTGSGPCVLGRCMRSYLSATNGRDAVTRPRATTYTIDLPSPGSITYTTDGSPPGSPTSSVPAPAPVRVTLDPYTVLRWQATFATGEREEPREFQHILDTRGNVITTPGTSTAPSDNNSGIVERLDVNGQGPVATVSPGASVTVTYDAQVWHARSNGYCTSCVVYMSLTRATETGTPTADCLGNVSAVYPGNTYTGRTFTFTAPTVPGIYPLYFRIDLDFSCRPGGGQEVGYLVVR